MFCSLQRSLPPYQPPTSNIYYNSGKVNLSALPEFLFLEELEMEEEVRICDYCGRVLAEEEGTPVDDELLCDDCVEEHCVTCDHCGETIWEQNSVSDEDTCLCQDCFDAHYYRCESCGQIVPESIVCWTVTCPTAKDASTSLRTRSRNTVTSPHPFSTVRENDTSA